MNYVLLSKIISHALRHEPEKYDLALKENGWVSIEALISGIRAICPEYNEIERQHIEKAVKSSGKKRHEIKEDEIRAIYGHSKQVELNQTSTAPPETLYHGTTVNSGLIICEEGLKKMGRQHVHLSSNIEDALVVAKRRKDEITVLEIKSEEAFKDGIIFYKNGNVWLCDYITAKYISQSEISKANI